MSFAADLKDFSDSFRETYKTFKPDWRNEYYHAELEKAQGAQKTLANAYGNPQSNTLTREGGVDLGDANKIVAPTARKLPTFAQNDPLDIMTRVVHGEASNTDPEEQKAIAATILNRAKASGKPVAAEVFAPAQFEAVWDPKNRARIEKLSPDSPEYQRARASVEAAVAGEDPTGGATHFYAPGAQAGLGRPTPSWARGKTGVDIGPTRFYKLPYGGKRAALDLNDGTVDDPALQPTVYAASGGVIPTSTMNDSTTAGNAGSNPVVRDIMDANASSQGEPDPNYDPSSLVDVEGARQAVAGGLKFGQRLLGLETHHAAVPDAVQVNPDGVKALHHNINAAAPHEVQAIRETVDPQGQLPPELREVAAYNAVRKYWLAMGEPQKADRMAWQMLSSAKAAASQYGAVALAIDDPKKRAEVIAKGYNELVPDGNSMKITGSSPQGVKFQLVDPSGKITEQGALAMDDMVQMATGMVNGTQWLQSMTGFATSAPTNAEKALEKRSKARAAFEARSVDDRDYVNTLSDEDRAAYLDMDPRDRKEFAQRHQARSEQERKQSNFETRLAVGAENMDRKEATDLAKTAIRLGMWEETRNQVMTMHEQKLAQLQAQEEGRNTRFGTSQAARRARQQEIDQRILGKRTATTDGAGVKLTPKEAAENRRVAGVDAEAAGRMGAIDTEASDETGVNYTDAQRSQRTAIQLGAGFNRAAKDDPSFKGAKPKAEAFDEMRGAIGQAYGFMNSDGKVLPDKKALAPVDHNRMALIGTDLMRSGIPAETAAELIRGVHSGQARPQVVQRGNETLVSLGGGMPPVRMSEDGYLALAQLAGATAKPGARVEPLDRWSNTDPSRADSSTALPGRTGNTRAGVNLDMPYGGVASPTDIESMPPSAQAGAVNLYDQRQGMLSRRAATAESINARRQPTRPLPGEEAYLRQRLGRYARPDMTIDELRREERALLALETNQGRSSAYGRR